MNTANQAPRPHPRPGSANVDEQFLSNLRRQKKTPPVNIVTRLIHREIFFVNPNVSPFVAIRKFHQNLLPNFSVENVEKPNCFLRKFTYDGRYLMAFSHDQTSVEFYEYQGPAAAAHLMAGINSSEQDNLKSTNRDAARIRKQIFNCLFKLKHSVMVTSNGEQLSRECSLFTEDHRFAIVVSAAFINEEAAIFYNLYQNNESLPVGSRTILEDYTVHIVDIEKGIVTSRKAFKTDKIYLSYNHGIYLYKNILAVLSIQHQTIYIFNINSDGKFDEGRKIGRFCFENDEHLVDSAYRTMASRPNRGVSRAYSVHPFRETAFNALKHRLLVALYKYAEIKSRQTGSNLPRKQFFRNFSTLASLRIWKMQLLDEDHLLIKYEQETDKATAAELLRRTWNVFVVYNYKTAQIVNLYPQFSEELFYIYENLSDYFRYPHYYICSLSNNIYAKQIHQQLIKTCTEAKGGSYQDAVKMLLTILPLNAQSYTPSPYLDLSLFSYDDRVVCLYEKPRQCSEMPARFYSRDTGQLLYRMHMNHHIRHGNRRMAAYIFHPTDPFVISVMRINAQYIVNFHIRHNNPGPEEPRIRPSEYFAQQSVNVNFQPAK